MGVQRQRWVMVLEDRLTGDEVDDGATFYTKADIRKGVMLDELNGLSIRSLKKETK